MLLLNLLCNVILSYLTERIHSSTALQASMLVTGLPDVHSWVPQTFHVFSDFSCKKHDHIMFLERDTVTRVWYRGSLLFMQIWLNVGFPDTPPPDLGWDRAVLWPSSDGFLKATGATHVRPWPLWVSECMKKQNKTKQNTKQHLATSGGKPEVTFYVS